MYYKLEDLENLMDDELFDVLGGIDKDQAETLDYDDDKNLTDDEYYNWKNSFLTHQNLKLFGSPIRVNFDSPLETFRNFIAEEIMQLIVDETCKYASQNSKQMEFDVKDPEAILGTLVIMGFNTFPSVRLYWSADGNRRVNRVVNIMSQKRFLTILRFLHLIDNEKMSLQNTPEFDNLYSNSISLKA
ncbi:hypothetical protein ILUMI_04306 [Ignelater luminosus]|uniref:PiggyBac transposable element-derived protein domain-containing protein n=1 Tax=Ignelater luminosus TaxID=2038154 RepID=A0A8K0DF06_IGNLU|nr:hypothetical protein ILUMI_04306 [Ignelater luminosus]